MWEMGDTYSHIPAYAYRVYSNSSTCATIFRSPKKTEISTIGFELNSIDLQFIRKKVKEKRAEAFSMQKEYK